VTPVDVIILSLGLFVAVMLVSRQYNKTETTKSTDDDSSLREIAIEPEVNGAVVKAASDKKRHQLLLNLASPKATIDRRLTAIGDFRSDECVNTQYDVSRHQRFSSFDLFLLIVASET
jgi:hypothetical protein